MTGNYMSLYDYLGFAAGKWLGATVWTQAIFGNVGVIHKNVSNPKYTGNVCMYPFDFLEDFFQTYPHYKVKGFSPITESIPGQKNTEKIMEKKPMVVLSLSGGLDSSTLLLRCLKEYEKVICLSFDYGQKHKVELEKATNLVSYLNMKSLKDGLFGKITHKVIRLDGLSQLLNSSLVEGGNEVPEGHYEDDNMKETVVPNRNKIFSSIIQAVALSMVNRGEEKREIDIAMGIHAGDHSIYPDCRDEFRVADYEAFLRGNWDADYVSYYTPYLFGDKFSILQDGEVLCKELGLDFDEVYFNTSTSYKPIWMEYEMDTSVEDTRNESEGVWVSDYKSASSVERIEAFIKLGRPDPINYADETGLVGWEDVKKYVEQILNKK